MKVIITTGSVREQVFNESVYDQIVRRAEDQLRNTEKRLASKDSHHTFTDKDTKPLHKMDANAKVSEKRFSEQQITISEVSSGLQIETQKWCQQEAPLMKIT